VVLSLPFFIVVALVLPLLAWRSHRQGSSREVADEALPSVRTMALNTIVLQTVVSVLAWLAGVGAGITVSWRSQLGPIPLLAAIAVVALGMALA